jgi:hypothetical protein
MDTGANLIRAVAALLWPIFAFVFLWWFRAEIGAILRRLSHLRKGKLLGQELELEHELDQLAQSAEKARIEAATAIPQPDTRNHNRPSNELELELLRDVARSPRITLMLLGAEIEKRVRQLLAATGWHQNISPFPLSKSIDELRRQGTLPEHVSGSLKLFLDVRNKIVHGQLANDDDTLRAIDSGLTVLKAIDSVPTETNVVYHPGVHLYSDSGCSQKMPEVLGVILETTSPGGATKQFRIFPTTRTHFKEGQRVAWEWSFDKTWGPSWYKDPDTGEIRKAWDSSAEFIGRHLDEI